MAGFGESFARTFSPSFNKGIDRGIAERTKQQALKLQQDQIRSADEAIAEVAAVDQSRIQGLETINTIAQTGGLTKGTRNQMLGSFGATAREQGFVIPKSNMDLMQKSDPEIFQRVMEKMGLDAINNPDINQQTVVDMLSDPNKFSQGWMQAEKQIVAEMEAAKEGVDTQSTQAKGKNPATLQANQIKVKNLKIIKGYNDKINTLTAGRANVAGNKIAVAKFDAALAPIIEKKEALEAQNTEQDQIIESERVRQAGIEDEQSRYERNLSDKPPQSREIKVGDNIITEEWNQETGQWQQIAEGERFSRREEGASSSAPERMIARVLELESLDGASEEEIREKELLISKLLPEGTRFSVQTLADGRMIKITNNGVEVIQDPGTGLDAQALSERGEDRRTIARLNNDFKTFALPDIKFLKNTQTFTNETGRQSVTDERLTRMFMSTLPGVGGEVAQGDLARVADLPGIDESIVVAIKSITEGTTLPPEIREAFTAAIVQARNQKLINIRNVTKSLGDQARDGGLDGFRPVGAEAGTEFNPIETKSFSGNKSEFEKRVKVGEWFYDNGVPFKRTK